MKQFLILILLALWTSISYSQYSNNKEKFIKEFQKTLSEYGKGDYQEFAKTFQLT